MNPARIVIVVVAIVAALGLALLVHAIIKPKSPTVVQQVAAPSAGPPMTRVLTAKQDLAVGDRLAVDNMAWQPWPAATLNAAYITDGAVAAPKPVGPAGVVNQAGRTVTDIATGGGPQMQAMIGDIVKEPIYAGEPITDRKIVRGGDSSYMAVRLPPGTLAMSVPVNVENGAGGFIQPGDRIDMLSSHPDTAKNGQGGMVTETVLANVKVLAVDQHTDTPRSSAAMPGATLTLEIPADDVEAVARAKSEGGLVMALRSYADIGGGARGPSSGHSVRLFKGGGPAELVIAR